MEIERETDATAVVNGHWGFGHVTATEAMHIAIQKARKSAVGIVTVHQCNHIGRLGGYPVLAAAENMAGLMSNNGHGADLSMAPWGGLGRILPANCLAVAFPSDRDFPIALDLTAATAAGGKMRVALARGERVPKNWLIDAEGNPTTDPADLRTWQRRANALWRPQRIWSIIHLRHLIRRPIARWLHPQKFTRNGQCPICTGHSHRCVPIHLRF